MKNGSNGTEIIWFCCAVRPSCREVVMRNPSPTVDLRTVLNNLPLQPFITESGAGLEDG